MRLPATDKKRMRKVLKLSLSKMNKWHRKHPIFQDIRHPTAHAINGLAKNKQFQIGKHNPFNPPTPRQWVKPKELGLELQAALSIPHT